jgi:hypothetical protein
MPGKSRKAKAKRYQQIKRSQNTQRQDSTSAQVPATVVTPKASTPDRAVPSAKQTATLEAQYAYVPGDLRRIGILTGIMIVILIILYFILR